MSIVSIIGKGTMGQAIGSIVTKSGRDIEWLDRQSTRVNGDIVILAVPYRSLAEITARLGNEFAGKTVVDICNPVNFETFDGLLVPPDSSAAEELAKTLPHAHVLKGFNTTLAATLHSGTVGVSGPPTTVLIAGDSEDAKSTLSQIVTEGGRAALDAGPLRRARELEAIGFEQLVLASSGKIAWTGGFAIIP